MGAIDSARFRRRRAVTAVAAAKPFNSACAPHRPYRFAPLFDRIHHAPKGYDGGSDGAKATVSFSTGEVVTQKGTRDLAPDTEILLNLPGGGGLGLPAQRDPVLIEQDLRNQIVTPAAAERDYGVTVTSDGAVSRLVSV